MQLPNIDVRADELELINRILILSGLMPISQQSADISTDSDAGMVRTLLIAQHREVQSHGWWFNTWERYFVEGGTAIVNLPNNYTPLACEPSPVSYCDPQGAYYEINNNNIISIKDASYNTEIPQEDTYLDIVVALEMRDCPTLFNDYVVYKTARLFGRSLGIKVDTFDEQMAYTNLLEQNERSSPSHNWFNESSIARF